MIILKATAFVRNFMSGTGGGGIGIFTEGREGSQMVLDTVVSIVMTLMVEVHPQR